MICAGNDEFSLSETAGPPVESFDRRFQSLIGAPLSKCENPVRLDFRGARNRDIPAGQKISHVSSRTPPHGHTSREEFRDRLATLLKRNLPAKALVLPETAGPVEQRKAYPCILQVDRFHELMERHMSMEPFSRVSAGIAMPVKAGRGVPPKLANPRLNQTKSG